MTTTALQRRSGADESLLRALSRRNPEQTAAIQQRQRDAETIDAMLDAEDARSRSATLHQNAQRLLRADPISNPYADQLSFTKQRVRNRRDQAKYLALIKAVAFLHQYQREVKTNDRKGARSSTSKSPSETSPSPT